MALHPAFVVLLVREPGARRVRAPGRRARIGSGPPSCPAAPGCSRSPGPSGAPLDVSAAAAGWLAEQLPPGEATAVHDLGLELVVPIDAADGQIDAMLVLGRRRSEEPYAPEDQELLWTIARSLAVLDRRDRVGGRRLDVPGVPALRHVLRQRNAGVRGRHQRVVAR